MDLPRTAAAEKASRDGTGAVTRMEPIWETMEALERENIDLRKQVKDLEDSHTLAYMAGHAEGKRVTRYL